MPIFLYSTARQGLPESNLRLLLAMAFTFISSVLLTLSAATADNGAAEVLAASPEDRRAQAPALAVTSDGTVHVIWIDKGAVGEADRKGAKVKGTHHSHQAFADLYYARLLPDAGTFSDVQMLNPEPGQVWGFSISRPVMATDAMDRVHIVYPVNGTSPETGKSVASSFYTRSTDLGGHFDPPTQLNRDPTEDLSALIMGGLAQAQVFGGLAVSPEGSVHTFWLDTRGMDASMRAALYYRRSDNGGAEFGEEVRIQENNQCPCCQISAVAQDESSLFVSARQIHGDNIRTPMMMHSGDGGASFSSPVAMGGTPWRLEGCPLKLTAMAVTGSRVHSLVHNGAEEPPGLLYSHALDDAGSFITPKKIHPDAAISDSPAMASSGQMLLAVWHAKEDGPRQIFYRFSLDGGETFLPVQRFDTGEASVGYPAVATAPDGRFVVAWQADEVIHVTYLNAPQQTVAGL